MKLIEQYCISIRRCTSFKFCGDSSQIKPFDSVRIVRSLHHTLVILDRDGTAVEVASDLPVTLSNSSAAYLQNSAWSEALSSMTGSRIKTKHNKKEKAKN